MGSEYLVRPFEPGDEMAFLALFSDVFGGGSSEWFDWKYVDNPYADEVPIIVAEEVSSGKCVGFRSHIALELRTDEWTVEALQPCDTMVHEDHRRRGLFTRMTELAIDRFAADGAHLFFNFPNELSRRADQKLGWEEVGPVHTNVRIHSPGRWARATSNGLLVGLGRATTPFVRGFNAVVDAVPHRADVQVERLDGPPGEIVPQLAAGTQERLDVHRTPEFYDWRYDRPDVNYTVYASQTRGEPAAALVTARRDQGDYVSVDVVEAVPKHDRDPEAVYGWKELLAEVIGREDADVYRLFAGEVPRAVTRRLGFFSTASPPLSLIDEPPRLYTYPLSNGRDVPLAASELTDMENWNLSWIAWDIA